jgi:hypothetical protein
MSNHGGSYLLNYVLRTMDKYHMLENIDAAVRHKFIKSIVEVACDECDCNPGVILEDIGGRYQICYLCLNQKELVEYDTCADCIANYYCRRTLY